MRLSRSKKTGGSKGYAFVEFKDAGDTKIVAEAMDKYLLAGKQLVVKQLPTDKVHSRMWKGANEKFSTFPFRKQHAERVNKPKSQAAQKVTNERLTKKEGKKRKQLAALGIDFVFPGYAAMMKVGEGHSDEVYLPPFLSLLLLTASHPSIKSDPEGARRGKRCCRR